MKWKFSSKKEGSGSSRREILQNYEQKYLEKFDKVKSEIQKVQKKQKELEVKELKDRIARRLKLEKEEKASSDFVKTTLETAVSEGWTKTKTVEELRKSKEKITIKKAKELTKEAFDKKPKKK